MLSLLRLHVGDVSAPDAFPAAVVQAVVTVAELGFPRRYFVTGVFKPEVVFVRYKMLPLQSFGGCQAFGLLTGRNKELLIIPGASHVDLYDDVAGVIPYDKIEAFFKENLK